MSLSALLDSARAGDAAARERLLREIYPEVERMVHVALQREFRPKHRWLGPLFSTADIVQDVFLAVVQLHPEEGAHDDRQLFAWLALQVKSRILDRVRFHLAARRDARHQGRLERSGDETVGMAARDRTPSVLAALDERAALVVRVVGELEPRDRELWRLRVEEEQEFGTIAQALGLCSDEAARSAFRRVQARLALRLHRLGVRGDAEVTEA